MFLLPVVADPDLKLRDADPDPALFQERIFVSRARETEKDNKILNFLLCVLILKWSLYRTGRMDGLKVPVPQKKNLT